jgi:hypothetical protein
MYLKMPLFYPHLSNGLAGGSIQSMNTLILCHSAFGAFERDMSPICKLLRATLSPAS